MKNFFLKENRKFLILKNKILKVHRMSFYRKLICFNEYKYWMFFDNYLSNVEILEPTLKNINMMRCNNLTFVVKGFKSPVEFFNFDRLLNKISIVKSLLIPKIIGQRTIINVLTSMLNNEKIDFENCQDPKDKFCLLKDTESYNRYVEKEKHIVTLKHKYNKLLFILRRKLTKLIKEHRVVTVFDER